jgi:hypothetical protein
MKYLLLVIMVILKEKFLQIIEQAKYGQIYLLSMPFKYLEIVKLLLDVTYISLIVMKFLIQVE